jgi:hypothetical protein
LLGGNGFDFGGQSQSSSNSSDSEMHQGIFQNLIGNLLGGNGNGFGTQQQSSADGSDSGVHTSLLQNILGNLLGGSSRGSGFGLMGGQDQSSVNATDNVHTGLLQNLMGNILGLQSTVSELGGQGQSNSNDSNNEAHRGIMQHLIGNLLGEQGSSNSNAPSSAGGPSLSSDSDTNSEVHTGILQNLLGNVFGLGNGQAATQDPGEGSVGSSIQGSGMGNQNGGPQSPGSKASEILGNIFGQGSRGSGLGSGKSHGKGSKSSGKGQSIRGNRVKRQTEVALENVTFSGENMVQNTTAQQNPSIKQQSNLFQSKMNNNGKRSKGQMHKKYQSKNTFPFGKWNWGLPDLGFVSGKPKCEKLSKSCRSSLSPIESWYSDCVCPWVWNGKSQKCPFGDDLRLTVAKANILYLKNHPQFPDSVDYFDIINNFTSSIENSPVELSDIDSLLISYIELLQKESNTSTVKLMLSYLEQLSPEFRQSLYQLIRELQGMIYPINDCWRLCQC